jgi:hypothetical protein
VAPVPIIGVGRSAPVGMGVGDDEMDYQRFDMWNPNFIPDASPVAIGLMDELLHTFAVSKRNVEASLGPEICEFCNDHPGELCVFCGH